MGIFSSLFAFAHNRGTAGNFADRVKLGYVRDMLNFDFIEFPVFNIADAALTVGATLICIYFLFVYKEPGRIGAGDGLADGSAKADGEGDGAAPGRAGSRMEKQVIIVDEDDRERIDSYLAEKLENVSRSMVQKHIASGNVLLNGKQVKPRQLVSAGDIIEVTIPEPQPCEILPENIPLDIIYQDEYIAVINKQAGLSVHPANGVYSGTLVNALLYHIKDLSSIGGVVRPGIVHRIDKNTTGLLVVAKNDEAHISLSRQIAERAAAGYTGG